MLVNGQYAFLLYNVINLNCFQVQNINRILCSIFQFWSRDKIYKMAAAIVNHQEIYTWPYLRNRSTDFHKMCCKMLVSPTPFFEIKDNLCNLIPLNIQFSLLENLDLLVRDIQVKKGNSKCYRDLSTSVHMKPHRLIMRNMKCLLQTMTKMKSQIPIMKRKKTLCKVY